MRLTLTILAAALSLASGQASAQSAVQTATPATAQMPTTAPAVPKTIRFCRPNRLIGYGLVVGLANTGDGFKTSPMTAQSIKAALQRSVDGAKFDPAPFEHNVAAVLVTASMRSCAFTDGSYTLKVDTKVDLTLSALGDATSLQGGALLLTPLVGADGNAYAVGQGVLAACPGPQRGVGACISNGGLVAR